MLIRSQDRTTLVDTSGTTIRAVKIISEKIKLLAYGNNQPMAKGVETLGIYDTEKRAIEVLDCIQDAYADSLYTGCDGIVATNRVFEMPEE